MNSFEFDLIHSMHFNILNFLWKCCQAGQCGPARILAVLFVVCLSVSLQWAKTICIITALLYTASKLPEMLHGMQIVPGYSVVHALVAALVAATEVMLHPP